MPRKPSTIVSSHANPSQQPQVLFSDLLAGDTFDFTDDHNPHLTSFSLRCVKLSERQYEAIGGSRLVYRVGTVNAKVYHVTRPSLDAKQQPVTVDAALWSRILFTVNGLAILGTLKADHPTAHFHIQQLALAIEEHEKAQGRE